MRIQTNKYYINIRKRTERRNECRKCAQRSVHCTHNERKESRARPSDSALAPSRSSLSHQDSGPIESILVGSGRVGERDVEAIEGFNNPRLCFGETETARSSQLSEQRQPDRARARETAKESKREQKRAKESKRDNLKKEKKKRKRKKRNENENETGQNKGVCNNIISARYRSLIRHAARANGQITISFAAAHLQLPTLVLCVCVYIQYYTYARSCIAKYFRQTKPREDLRFDQCSTFDFVYCGCEYVHCTYICAHTQLIN